MAKDFNFEYIKEILHRAFKRGDSLVVDAAFGRIKYAYSFGWITEEQYESIFAI